MNQGKSLSLQIKFGKIGKFVNNTQLTKSKRIVLIGAGRLATCLGQALKQTPCNEISVVSRSEESASVLGKKLNCAYTSNFSEMPKDADTYVISITDAAVVQVLQHFPDLGQALVVHTAGSLPMSLFEGSKMKHYGVFYPMQTFSKERKVDFRTIPCFIEANNAEAMKRLEAFASSLSQNIYHLSSDDRRYLHLSAVLACNFANHCYAMAHEIAEQHHIPFDSLLPLIDETAQKVHHLSPVEAQTGPAVRHDENILKAQEQLLADNPKLQELYRLMSNDIQRLSK